MRGNDRRRSPPPRRDDRRFSGGPGGGPPPGGPGWNDRRRPRSISPPDRFRRSPPGKRFRRDDYDDYDRHGGGVRHDRSGWHGGPGGPRGGGPYDDRYDGRGPPPGPRGPLTFVEFVRDLPPHIGPEQANDEYRRYMADWWGDAIKAEFEERKADPQLRRRFDPREVQRVMDRRNELAAAAAAAFAEEHGAGGSGEEQACPGPEGFTEGAAEGEGAQGEALPPALAPALCWQPAQLAADLALAKQLMQAADKEKGISSNPLQPAAPAAAAYAAAPTGEGGEEQLAAEQEQAEPEAAAADDPDAELSPEEQATKLDQVLVYLWRVHGIDYYGGREYTNPAEPGRAAARRTQRGPQPSEADVAAAAAAAAETEAGEAAAAAEGAEPAAAAAADEATKPEGVAAADGIAIEVAQAVEAAAEGGKGPAADGVDAAADAAAAGAKSPTAVAAAAASPTAAGSAGKKQLQLDGAGEEGREYEQRVVGFWRFRLEKGDPLEMPLHRQQIEADVEKFLEAQIIKIEDNKWGNKLSSKMFMGRDFVVKHLRNKHGHVLQAERERLQEEAYWQNFRAFKREEQRRQEEEQERVMAGMMGRGGGRGGGGGGMMPLDAAAAMALNPGMMMAPIIMPTAGGMAPVILPMDMVMGMGMAGAMGGGGGRGGGGRGGRGGGPGSGRGGRGGGRGGPMLLGGGTPGAKLDGAGNVREYFDLDAPQNNRAVLDYGDL